MRPFFIRPKAIQDLEEIADYTFEQWGSEQEELYLDLLQKAFLAISKNPNLGRLYNEVYPGLRRYLAGRHIVLYLVSNEGVEIVRVRHQSMDYDSQL